MLENNSNGLADFLHIQATWLYLKLIHSQESTSSSHSAFMSAEAEATYIAYRDKIELNLTETVRERPNVYCTTLHTTHYCCELSRP